MIRSHQLGQESRVHAEVVDAPPDVPRAHACALTPPGVVARLAAKLPKAVDPAALEQTPEPGALLREESRVVLVLLGVGEVDRSYNFV